MQNFLYQLSDPTQNVPEADFKWIASLKEQDIMCDCLNIKRRSAIDVYLNEKIKKSFAPITFADGTRVGMVKKDIISIIGLSLFEKVYFIGKVYDINHNLSEDYVSLVPKINPVYIRGGKESTCSICDKCGVVLYFPLPLGQEYLVKNQIPNYVLFPSNFISGIIVNEDIYKTVKQSEIKKIGYQKLPIKENAIDGYDQYLHKYLRDISLSNLAKILNKLKSLKKKETNEYISNQAFEIYLKYENLLTEKQDFILLKLIAMNEGKEFQLSEKEVSELLLELNPK